MHRNKIRPCFYASMGAWGQVSTNKLVKACVITHNRRDSLRFQTNPCGDSYIQVTINCISRRERDAIWTHRHPTMNTEPQGRPLSHHCPTTRTLLSQRSGTSVPPLAGARPCRRPLQHGLFGQRSLRTHAEAISGMVFSAPGAQNPCRRPHRHVRPSSTPAPGTGPMRPRFIRREACDVTDVPGTAVTPGARHGGATVAPMHHGGVVFRKKHHGGAGADPTASWDKSARLLGQKCPGGGRMA